MSRLWSFHSFAPSSLDRFVGSGNSDAEEAVVEAVTWDEWGDMPSIERLARDLVRSGANYDRLSAEDARLLDQIIAMLFSPEGLEERLDVEHESPDGLHPSIIRALIERAPNPDKLLVLPLLVSGRRLGQSMAADCEYCIFSSAEVQSLHDEIDVAASRPGDWFADYVPQLIDECLLGPLGVVRSKGKALAALLG